MTDRQRLVSRIAVAIRLSSCGLEAEPASRFISEWLDGHKVEGAIADSLKLDSLGRWKRFVRDVLQAAKTHD